MLSIDLQMYINNRINLWRKLVTDMPLIPVHRRLSSENKKIVIDHLESDLSPENLSCDGELSPEEIEWKWQRYKKLLKEISDQNWPE